MCFRVDHSGAGFATEADEAVDHFRTTTGPGARRADIKVGLRCVLRLHALRARAQDEAKRSTLPPAAHTGGRLPRRPAGASQRRPRRVDQWAKSTAVVLPPLIITPTCSSRRGR